MKTCYCGSNIDFDTCCNLIIEGGKKAETPEQLMRSRYSAYVLQKGDYLVQTTHTSQRKYYSKAEILKWAKANTWLKLEVIVSTASTVEFKAYYLDENLQAQVHHEKSSFKQENGNWFYVNGEFY